MEELKKNQTLNVCIDGYTSDGFGVGHAEGRAIFVPRALPGEQWQIRLLKVGASAIYARGENLLRASEERVEPDCPHFGRCGGCDVLHMSYEEELRFKLGRVNDALERIGGQTVRAEEILGSDSIHAYRNKAVFNVSSAADSPAFGFYRERSHTLVPIDTCLLQTELSCRAARAVTDFMRQYGFSAYDEASGKGHVRHIFFRQAFHGNDAVVCVVSARGFGVRTETLVSALYQACPELTGIVLNINKTRGNTILSGDFHTLWGRAEVQDSLCGITFRIAPQAFFQINPPQAEKLYRRAAEYAVGETNGLFVDLYCGTGTISLCIAGYAKQVIGAEIVPEAVENARENALRNGIGNVEFLCADAGEAARALSARGLRPDCVVVDPPRKGVSEQALHTLASMGADRIVYVSCDPSTLARDIRRLNNMGYVLCKATAVDMFPRTRHVETVVLMSRKDT